MCAQTDFAQLWDAAIPGVELFKAQLFRHRFGKHFHDAYTIGLNEAGQGQCFYRSEHHDHYPGSFNCINPGEVHTGEASGKKGWAFRNIYISVPLVEQVLSQLDWPEKKLPYFPDIVVDDQSLQDSFYQLFRGLSCSTSQLEQQSLLLQFLADLFSKHAQFSDGLKPARAEVKAISLIRDYLEAHCTEAVSLSKLGTSQ